MKRDSRLWPLLALMITFALVAAACSDDEDSEPEAEDVEAGDASDTTAPPPEDEPEEPAASGGAVSVGIVEPSWIDSFNTQDSEGFQVVRLLFDGLTDYGADLEAVPAVATEWTT
jgi:ABC-type oligopeptide transport system substrate-binding subunit